MPLKSWGKNQSREAASVQKTVTRTVLILSLLAFAIAISLSEQLSRAHDLPIIYCPPSVCTQVSTGYSAGTPHKSGDRRYLVFRIKRAAVQAYMRAPRKATMKH